MTDTERDLAELRRDPELPAYRSAVLQTLVQAEPGSREELALAHLLRALSEDEPS